GLRPRATQPIRTTPTPTGQDPEPTRPLGRPRPTTLRTSPPLSHDRLADPGARPTPICTGPAACPGPGRPARGPDLTPVARPRSPRAPRAPCPPDPARP